MSKFRKWVDSMGHNSGITLGGANSRRRVHSDAPSSSEENQPSFGLSGALQGQAKCVAAYVKRTLLFRPLNAPLPTRCHPERTRSRLDRTCELP